MRWQKKRIEFLTLWRVDDVDWMTGVRPTPSCHDVVSFCGSSASAKEQQQNRNGLGHG
jgi:hypothetical protein